MISRLKWIAELLRDFLLMPIALVAPRNRKKIVFGAWSGQAYTCNPKYLFEYVCNRGGFECIWIGDESLREMVMAVKNAKFVRRGSLGAYYHWFTAGFCASNVNCYSDIVWAPTCGRVVILYLSHGYPDKKAKDQLNGAGVSINARDDSGKGKLRCIVTGWLKRWQSFCYATAAWSSASSPQGDRLRVEGQPFRLSMERMLHAGTPRADYIISNANNKELKSELRAKFARLLNVPTDRRWFVFVPTWRHDPKYLYSFSTSGRANEIDAFLAEQGAIVIEKQHPKTIAGGSVKDGAFGNVVVVSSAQAKQIDTQELLLACDVLITDYSSIYYDFYLMNRPVIHFTYDFDHAYAQDFGFDFDIREYGGGPFAYKEEELLKYMAMDDAVLLSLRHEKTHDQLSYETGHACEAYYDLLCRISAGRGLR